MGGAPNPSGCALERVQSITAKKVIEAHVFMMEELEDLLDTFSKLPDMGSYDRTNVIIVAQAILGSRIEAKFGVTMEDIESAVLMNHTILATHQEFAGINIKMKHAMGKLAGNKYDNVVQRPTM